MDLEDRARGWSSDLRVHLVGGDFDDRFVGGYAVALGLAPLEDRSFGDRVTHLRHDDLDRRFDGHYMHSSAVTRRIFLLPARAREHDDDLRG